jgi:hypothetical protein
LKTASESTAPFKPSLKTAIEMNEADFTCGLNIQVPVDGVQGESREWSPSLLGTGMTYNTYAGFVFF